MGNDSLVGMLNEARTRYFNQLDFASLEKDGKGLINADLAVIYRSEAKHGEVLVFEVAAQAFQKHGCDFIYRVTERDSGRLIALAKTAMLMFDYKTNKLSLVSENFQHMFN
jgi:acyl-CoA thioesterase FadM